MTDLLPCQRCGQPVYPLGDLAALARQISNRAGEGLQALDRMRLAIPSTVGAALQEARLDGAILDRRISCHAGTCLKAPLQGPLVTPNSPSTTAPESGKHP